MRIISGTAKGRPLTGPDFDGLRPTSDRTRQVLFDLLGQAFAGGGVLDLYCGTGALALEALSRGCTDALCLDADPRAIALTLSNAKALGFEKQLLALRAKLPDSLPSLRQSPRLLVFADPPYDVPGAGDTPALVSLLHWVSASGILAPDGVLVIETSRHSDFDVPSTSGLTRTEPRAVGDTVLHLYTRGG